MGQYYKPYLRGRDGAERAFNPQNAVYMARNGLEGKGEISSHSYDWDDPNSWGSCFSGMKLMEHSWIENDFVGGVLEAIEDSPCQVAWVGDYADDCGDVYARLWGDDCLPELPFDGVPTGHGNGYLANLSKGVYVDLAEYREKASYSPRWDKGNVWCIHPLPLLTAIGNGRGGGDYHGDCMEMVGAWAMDEIAYTRDAAKVAFMSKVDVQGIAFREED